MRDEEFQYEIPEDYNKFHNLNSITINFRFSEFLIDEWTPYYIEGLPKGEITIKLELIDKSGKLIDTPFNPSVRKVLLKE